MEGEKITNLGQAIEAVGNHHRYTTPRLPNYLQTLSNLIPAWPVRALHGLMLAVTFLLIALSCGGWRIMRSAGLVAVIWLSAWITLPLNNFMISSDFSFNYLWTSPLIMLFVYLFTTGRMRSGRWSFVPWVLAAVTGTMHEGAALPVAAGCAVMIIIDPRDRRRRAALLAVMTVITMLFFFNSGMMERIDQHVTGRDNTFLKYMALNLMIESYGLYLAIAGLVIALVKGGRDGLQRFAIDNIVWIVAEAWAMAIAFATMMRGRALWFVDLFGIILFFKAVYIYYRWWAKPRRIVAIAAGAALLLSVTGSACMQASLSAESEAVARQLSETDTPVTFVDYLPPDMLPWWAFSVPQSITSGYPNSSLTMYFTDKAPFTLILPSDWEGKAPETWPKTAGDTGLSGRYPFLAGRKRLNSSYISVTFRHNPSISHRLATEGPVNTVTNLLRSGATKHTTVYPINEWAVEYMGDTLWCYYIGQLRHLDMNIGIASIDTIR